jgi:uncharacterized protein (TIGR00730 family)
MTKKGTQPKNSKKTSSLLAWENPEFFKTTSGRMLRILSEFSEPMHRFEQENIHDSIVFFGSARTLPKKEARAQLQKLQKEKASSAAIKKAEMAVQMSRYYEEAVQLSKKLSLWAKKEHPYLGICSGGGPGIMEAANRGAHLAKSPSIGLNIDLPFEQSSNKYISPELDIDFKYFFLRKFWFLYLAKAIVVFPGGFGTLDEIMETLTLIQTEKIKKEMPIVLYGREFWEEAVNLPYLAKTGMISPGDLKLFKVFDSVDESFEYLTKDLTRFFRKRDKQKKGKNPHHLVNI